MKTITYDDVWPNSWKDSYRYDEEEIYHRVRVRGYAYAYWNRQRRTLEAIDRVAQSGATILDIAGAQGNFSLLLAERGYNVTWNDLRADLVDYISLKHEKGNIHYAPGNAFDLGFKNEFDVVLITEIIEHVAHPDEFLKKVSQLVKPGGYIVMTTPNGAYFLNKLPRFSDCPDPSIFEDEQFKPNSDGHIFLLHSDEIESLAQATKLDLIDLQLFTNPLTHGHIKTEHLLKILPKWIVDSVEACTATVQGKIFHKANSHILAILRKV